MVSKFLAIFSTSWTPWSGSGLVVLNNLLKLLGTGCTPHIGGQNQHWNPVEAAIVLETDRAAVWQQLLAAKLWLAILSVARYLAGFNLVSCAVLDALEDGLCTVDSLFMLYLLIGFFDDFGLDKHPAKLATPNRYARRMVRRCRNPEPFERVPHSVG